VSHTCTLFVSLVGFEPRVERRLALLLDDCSALGARWRVVAEGGADLWIVDGTKARSPGGGFVEVGALRFRPGTRPDGAPLRMKAQVGYTFY